MLLIRFLRKLYLKADAPRWISYWQKHAWLRQSFSVINAWIYHLWYQHSHPVTKNPDTFIQEILDEWISVPYFNIIIVNHHSHQSQKTMASLKQQSYPYWSVYPMPQGQSTSALEQTIDACQASWTLFLFAGDELHPDALAHFAIRAQTDNYDLIYCDEDHVSAGGRYPYFKPDWSPWLLRFHNYLGNACLVRHKILKQIISSQALSEAWLRSLWLMMAPLLSSEQVCHIPRVLLHTSPKSENTHPLSSTEQTARLVAEHLKKSMMSATVSFDQERNIHQVQLLPQQEPLVSVIIPYRDQFHVLKRLFDSLKKQTHYKNVEWIFVDNQSSEQTKTSVLEMIEGVEHAHVQEYPLPFNYAAMNNLAVESASGEYLVLLNNDIEVLTPDWIRKLLGFAEIPGTGAVGAQLLYPNHLVQHAGVAVGIWGAAAHPGRFFYHQSQAHRLWLDCIREVSAVTAACLMVRKEYYLQVKGMHEDAFKVAFNDVDFCLKLQDAGYQNLYVPSVQMLHHESLSRGKDNTEEKHQRILKEISQLQQRWGQPSFQDPFYNPNLAMDAEDYFLNLKIKHKPLQ